MGAPATALLVFAYSPLPFLTAYMAAPTRLECTREADAALHCRGVDTWPLSEPSRGVTATGADRAEVRGDRLVWVTPAGDVVLPAGKGAEATAADHAAAAERLTAFARDASAARVSLDLRVARPLVLLMGALSALFYGIVLFGAGRNAVFTAEGVALRVTRRWFGLTVRQLELPVRAVSDVQVLRAGRNFSHLVLVRSDGQPAVEACSVASSRAAKQAAAVSALVQQALTGAPAP